MLADGKAKTAPIATTTAAKNISRARLLSSVKIPCLRGAPQRWPAICLPYIIFTASLTYLPWRRKSPCVTKDLPDADYILCFT